jgi:DNA-binding response OmpR family regulator
MPTPHPPIDTGHVLLVEDSEWDAKHMADAWPSQAASKLHRVRSAEDAVAWISRNGIPHLILLDIDLPGMSGLDLLTVLRRDAATATTPVVMLTSSHSGSTIRYAYQLGVNSYIRKPLSMRSLRETLQHLDTYWFKVSAVPESTVTAEISRPE